MNMKPAAVFFLYIFFFLNRLMEEMTFHHSFQIFHLLSLFDF